MLVGDYGPRVILNASDYLRMIDRTNRIALLLHFMTRMRSSRR
jgi:hypothetical protein